MGDYVYFYLQNNNRNELERLDKEKHDDFVGMLKGFVVNQVPPSLPFPILFQMQWLCDI